MSGGLTERNWVMTTVCARSFEVALGHTLDVLVPGPIMSMIEKVGGLAEQGLGMDLDGSGSKGDFAFEGAVVNGVASIGDITVPYSLFVGSESSSADSRFLISSME